MAISDERARLQAEQDAAVASALGSPERVAMLRALAGHVQPLSLSALAVACSLPLATIAAQLPVLVSAGAIERTEGAEESYRLAGTAFARAMCTMLSSMPPTPLAPHSMNVTLDAIVDQMASGVALYDIAGVLVRLNAAGERITRRAMRPGETMADRLVRYQMRRPDGTTMPVEESPSGRALRGEIIPEMECVIDGQHGPETWLRCAAAPLKDDHGAIVGAVVTFEDITEQQKLFHEEARQRALASAMLAHTFSGMAIFDATDAFRCLQHNDAFLHLLGPDLWARESIVGLPLDDLFEGDTRARVRALCKRVRATSEPYFNNEFSAVMPSSPQRRWYRLRLTPLRDERGIVTRLLTVALEITELVAARESSRRHAEEMQAIIEAMPEAVMLAASDGTFVLSNAAAARILGHPIPEKVPSTRYADPFFTYAPDGRQLELSELPIVRALHGETVVGEELIYQRAENERIDLLTSAAPVDFDDSGQIAGAVAVFQDITRIKELERQRDDFLGIAAHELRTPLSTILATLQAFLRRVRAAPTSPGEGGATGAGIGTEALVSGLERMYRQAQRLNKLVSDLLDSTRIRTGKLDYELERCDFVVSVREAVSGQRAANPGRTVSLTVPRQAVTILGDPFRLSQVVDNLVANALKYSAEEMPVVVSLRVDGRMARLRVTDKGVGVPPENMEHLFDRFYRVPGVDVQSGAGVGLGLGLHISQSIVERHGGRIEVRSTPGKGSTFIVSVPLLVGESSQDI